MATATKRKIKGTAAGRELIAGLREALRAAQSGDYSNLIVREVEIADPREYGPADIKALRAKLGVTQGIFARLVGVSADLVAHWEHGIRTPRAFGASAAGQDQRRPRDLSIIRRETPTSSFPYWFAP